MASSRLLPCCVHTEILDAVVCFKSHQQERPTCMPVACISARVLQFAMDDAYAKCDNFLDVIIFFFFL